MRFIFKAIVLAVVVGASCLAASLAWVTRNLPNESQMAPVWTAALQPTIDALERHREETGKYPDDLTKLVPKHMPAVPEASKIPYERAGRRSRLPWTTASTKTRSASSWYRYRIR